MKLIDAIGIVLIIVGIAMTVMNFRAERGPFADIQSVVVQAVPK